MREIDVNNLTRGQRKILLGQCQMAFMPRALDKMSDEEATERVCFLGIFRAYLEEALEEETHLTRFELAWVLISIAYSILFRYDKGDEPDAV